MAFRKYPENACQKFFIYFWIDEANSIVHIIAVIYAARDQKTIFESIETEEYK